MADKDVPETRATAAAETTAAIEPNFSDHDSAYDELSDDSSYTTSIASSITNYKYENGRRYHAYQEGRYILPNDEKEQERLDIQYHALRLAYGDKPFMAPIDEPTAVLDVGTGTGIWAMDVADIHPNAEVIGTDLSPIQPNWVPPNVKFEVDDVEQPWTFPKDHFDLIHTRILSGSIRDWPHFFEQSFTHCKPGGWIELQELDVDARTDDNSFPENSLIRKWCENQEEAAKKMGITLRFIGSEYKTMMEAAGFTNVVIREYKLPIGPWPADKELKEVGLFQLAAMLEGIDGLTLALWSRCLGYSEDEITVFLAKVKKEFRSSKVHSYWPLYAVYGQKPGS